MLNYVWLALIVLGIGVALTTDISEKNANKYKNGHQVAVEIKLDQPYLSSAEGSYDGTLFLKKQEFSRVYSENLTEDVALRVKLSFDKKKGKSTIFMKAGEKFPGIWKKMAKINGKEDDLTGLFNLKSQSDSTSLKGTALIEEVSFVKMKEVTNSALDYAGTAVNIALGLIGIMALWLGIMKVAEEAGLIRIISKALTPITRRIFPDVPSDHPAMGSMIMNISANMLGLSNAATPFGLKAMEELNKLNPDKTTASNAMCTFLAINTAGLTFIPATAIALRAAAGSSDPAIIIGTSVFGATCATIAGITSAKIFEKFPIRKGEFGSWLKSNLKMIMTGLSIVAVVALLVLSGLISRVFSLFSFINPDMAKSAIQSIAVFAIPALILTFLAYGAFHKIKVYEKFIEGAKEGFNVAVRIIPYLVAMLAAIGIFRAGGAMDFLIMILRPFTDMIGMPVEALPMALMRPLSGSGSLGIMAETMQVHGPDSLIGIMTSTFFGSSETTFYVLAVYFGSINISKTRHALPVGLVADITGTLGAVFICKLLFG